MSVVTSETVVVATETNIVVHVTTSDERTDVRVRVHISQPVPLLSRLANAPKSPQHGTDWNGALTTVANILKWSLAIAWLLSQHS